MGIFEDAEEEREKKAAARRGKAEPKPAEDKPAEDKRAAALWAEERGLLPQHLEGSAVPFAATRLNPNYWKWAAAKAQRRWDDSTEITSAELDQAINDATSSRIG